MNDRKWRGLGLTAAVAVGCSVLVLACSSASTSAQSDSGAHGDATTRSDAGVDGGKHGDAAADVTHPVVRRDAGRDAVADVGRPRDAKPDVKDTGVDSFVCSPADVPAEEPCVVTEQYGVFVAPALNGGSDTQGNGTRTDPYETIARGIAIASAAGKRVYVCAATYAEPLMVTTSTEVYGGLACPGAVVGGGSTTMAASGSGPAWAYTGVLVAVEGQVDEAGTTPIAAGAALYVDAVTGLHFEDMAFTAGVWGDAGVHGSFAAWVERSTGVSFTRVTFTSQAASSEAVRPPVTPSNWCPPPTQETTVDAAAAAPGLCDCTNFNSSAGGFGGQEDGPGSSGTAFPSVLEAAGGAGGKFYLVSGNCTAGMAGGNGAGVDAAAVGVVGEVAASGNAGNPGQGGGGGAGSTKGAGANGAAGGCGGTGGSGGQPGSSSYALVAQNSVVACTAVTLAPGPAGPGGSGGVGQDGEPGGVGEPGAGGCSGGAGGAGAGGGGGAGGAAGVSIGVLLERGDGGAAATVTIDGHTMTRQPTLAPPSFFIAPALAPGGAGGPGGAAAGNGGTVGLPGPPGPAGPPGAAFAVYSQMPDAG